MTGLYPGVYANGLFKKKERFIYFYTSEWDLIIPNLNLLGKRIFLCDRLIIFTTGLQVNLIYLDSLLNNMMP